MPTFSTCVLCIIITMWLCYFGSKLYITNWQLAKLHFKLSLGLLRGFWALSNILFLQIITQVLFFPLFWRLAAPHFVLVFVWTVRQEAIFVSELNLMGRLHVENRKFGEMRYYCREEMQNWFGPSKKLKLAVILCNTVFADPLLKPIPLYTDCQIRI